MSKKDEMRRHAWQLEAIRILQERHIARLQDALIVASVGGGKTLLARDFSEHLLSTTAIQRVIVVAPTRRLVRQWAREFKAAGILMTEVRSNRILRDGLPSDVHGYITTYAGMARWPDLHEAYAHEKSTMVVFDEIHHLGDEDHTSWGPAALSAFRSVTFRLALSGTPFRSSEKPIPYVRYIPVNGSNNVGTLDWDFNYSHGEAVADGVCRRTRFLPYDGDIEFIVDGTTYTKKFSDDLSRDLWSPRLFAAGRPRTRDGKRNRLLEKILFEANQRLTDIRNAGHKDAGGLIIANDIPHATMLKKFLEEVTGEVAVIVASKEGEDGEDDISDEAQTRLDAFAKGESRWLIAVRMVTEGVDIPRLRIGVYLAQITEELFFIQFLGRIVRKGRNSGADNGESFLFMFADARLVAIAARVEEDIERRIREKLGTGGGGGGGQRRDTGLIDADGGEEDTVVAGEAFSPDEMSAADELRARYPQLADAGLNIVDLARMAREFRGHQRADRGPAAQSYEEERRDIAEAVDAKVKKYCLRSGAPFDRVNGHLNQQAGLSAGQKRPQASIEQLKHMNRLIDELMAQLNGGADAA